MRAGIWLTALAIGAAALATYLRIDWKESYLAGTLFCGFLLLLALLTWRMSRYAIRHQSTPWLQFSVGVTAIPLLLAWTAASVVATAHKLAIPGNVTTKVLEDSQRTEFPKRRIWAELRGWQKSNGQPLVVAVGLSGGGYRAASVHAGLVAALDGRCVPIRYLTTVSGGSIIGAHYALGYTPVLFKQKLMGGPPRLADDILAIWFVLADGFLPAWNSADTYARHFAQTFFGTKSLADTGPPLLLVNATDLETLNEEPREIFFAGLDAQHPELDKTRLADVVAASGAFPGAFQPKTIRWRDHRGRVRDRRFIDGGVVENLGYAGLARLLWSRPDLPHVDLFIVVDAGAGPASGALPQKVGLIDLLTRSEGISYSIQHNLLRTYLSNSASRFERIQMAPLIIRAHGKEARDQLSGYTFTPTSGKAAQPIKGSDVADEVAKYRTLKELDQLEVEKAFWVGYTLGQHHWQDIDAFRVSQGGVGSPCPER
jgi:predicted acylesterase/phospholipase RssA